MATVVFQGLHSCSEQQKAGLPPPVTTLRLKLAPSKPADNGGWSFLQSLSANSESHQKSTDVAGGRKDGYAPPPLSLSNSVKLSDRSLEMCTENLGCETGSDVMSEWDATDMFPSFISPYVGNSDSKFPTTTRQHSAGGRRVNPSRNFPPPLTTMSGAESLQVRCRRVEGRLVADAVRSPSRQSCFRAERSQGRLRLSFIGAEPLETLNPEEVEARIEEDEPVRTDSMLTINRNADEDNRTGENAVTSESETATTTTTNTKPIGQVTKEGTGIGSEIECSGDARDEVPESVEVGSTGKFHRPTIRRCTEDEHEHHHHHHHGHHHHHQSISWDVLWVATS